MGNYEIYMFSVIIEKFILILSCKVKKKSEEICLLMFDLIFVYNLKFLLCFLSRI